LPLCVRPSGEKKDWLVWKLLENSFAEARGPAQQQAVCGVNSAPSENYQKSASGFSLKKVRILFRTDSHLSLKLRNSKASMCDREALYFLFEHNELYRRNIILTQNFYEHKRG